MIMPNYNGEKFITDSINAFLASGWANKELIIVDGKSTDLSHSIIREFSEENECIRWINEIDSGISDAINIGVRSCSGDVIGYLGSDDLLLKETLEKVSEYKSLLDFDAIYFDSYTYDYKAGTTRNRKCPDVDFTKQNLLKFGSIVGLQNIFFAARVYDDYKYDVENKYSMDYDIYFKIIEKYQNFVYIKIPSSINISHDNVSNLLSERQRQEAFQVAKKNVSSIKCYCNLYFNRRNIKPALNYFWKIK